MYDQQAIDKLVEIIKNNKNIYQYPKRLKGFLSDELKGKCIKESNLIILAAEARIPETLLNNQKPNTNWKLILGNLVDDLKSKNSLEQTAAVWTVHTWSIALGIIQEEKPILHILCNNENDVDLQIIISKIETIIESLNGLLKVRTSFLNVLSKSYCQNVQNISESIRLLNDLKKNLSSQSESGKELEATLNKTKKADEDFKGSKKKLNKKLKNSHSTTTNLLGQYESLPKIQNLVKPFTDYDSFFDAVKRNDVSKVEEYISQGANVNAKNNDGNTPLHWAALEGHTATVKLLIQKGADINMKEDKNDFTPLHLAAQKGHTATAKLLIQNGADVNAQDNNGYTPLHLAARWGCSDSARILIESGADVNAKILKGVFKDRTPLDWAARQGHTVIANLLRQYGAKSQ